MSARANYGDGESVELTAENTIILMFRGSPELDHVFVRIDDRVGVSSYNTAEIAEALASQAFPVAMYPNRPEWAIDRFVRSQMRDMDKLLDQP